MNDITFERIHKAVLETYTLEECAYRPNQKQCLELKAKVEEIVEGHCKNCSTCADVDTCSWDFPEEMKS